MGELTFRKIQYGKEVTRGTAVVATKMWPGKITVPTDRRRVFPEITTGRRVRSTRGTFPQLLVDGWQLSSDFCPFQVLPMIFSMALKGGVTATETTPAQADYAWDFSPSLTAANSQNAFTIEFGDDTQAYEMEYSMATRVRVAGTLGDGAGVTVEVEGFSKQISPVTFTAALTSATHEYMLANMAKLYIDPAWATLGATQKTGLLQAYSLEILTGLHPKFHANGVKTLTSHGEGFLDATLTLTYEGGSSADTEWDSFQAGTQRAIRLLIEGSQIGSGVNHKLQVDMFGEYEEVIPLASEKNGNNLHTAIFHMTDDNQATPHALAVNVVTNSNAV